MFRTFFLMLFFLSPAVFAQTQESWTDRFSVSGDLRMRHDYLSRTPTEKTERHRERFRLRLGSNIKVNETIEAKVRFATADGADPISTNTTMTDNSDKKDIFVDIAAIDWKLCESASLIFGKQENPLRPFRRSQLIYDEDYTPEGLSLVTDAPLFTRLGAYVLQERATQSDAHLMAALLGHKKDWNENFKTTFAVGYHVFKNIRGQGALGSGFHGNSSTGGPTPLYTHEYEVGELAAELRWKIKNASLSFYVDAIKNFRVESEDRDTAILLGTALQVEKWNVFYTYMAQGKNATVSSVNFSDLNTGIDGGFGHVVGFGRTVATNTNINLTYLHGQIDNSGSPIWMDRAFLDVGVTF